MDTPLSQSSVSLKLEEIKRRCEELDNESNNLFDLALEDPALEYGANDPYNHYR